MSDAHDEIGSFQRPTAQEKAKIQAALRSRFDSGAKPLISSTDRQKSNLEAIRQLKRHCSFYAEDGGKVTIIIGSRKLELWPSSNTWYSQAGQNGKGQFGTGIPHLVDLIEKRLIQKT